MSDSCCASPPGPGDEGAERPLLELFDGVIEVRASTGDNHLGGEDFNELLIDKFFAAHRQRWGASNKHDDQKLYQGERAWRSNFGRNPGRELQPGCGLHNAPE